MIGNDIVDLCDPDADSTSYRSRFDARVFTRSERQAIARAGSPERWRWRLWAAKEASYKLARKRDAETVFSPRAFEVRPCRDGPRNRSLVVHGQLSCYVEFDETPQRIHAIAVPRPGAFASVFAGVEATAPAAQIAGESAAVRRFACDAISQRYRLDPLEIRKQQRIPRLYCRDEPLGLGVSLSHHGGWLAFACSEGEGRGA